MQVSSREVSRDSVISLSDEFQALISTASEDDTRVAMSAASANAGTPGTPPRGHLDGTGRAPWLHLASSARSPTRSHRHRRAGHAKTRRHSRSRELSPAVYRQHVPLSPCSRCTKLEKDAQAERREAASERRGLERRLVRLQEAHNVLEQQLVGARENLRAQAERFERVSGELEQAHDELKAKQRSTLETLKLPASSELMEMDPTELGNVERKLQDALDLVRAAQRAKLADLSRERSCVICEEDASAVAFQCGHLLACTRCSELVSLCPVCRAPVRERLRVFLR